MKKIECGCFFAVIMVLLTSCNILSTNTVSNGNFETPRNEDVIRPEFEEKSFDKVKISELEGIGLNDREVQAIMDAMENAAIDSDLGGYAFKMQRGDEIDVEIKDSQFETNRINLVDFMGLNSHHAYCLKEDADISVREYLGQGKINDKDVYACACYSDFRQIDCGIKLNTIELFQVENGALYFIGTIDNGEINLSTDFTKQEYPLEMELSKEYAFPKESNGVYSNCRYEVLGFKDVTVNGKKFETCAELRQIDEFAISSPSNHSGFVISRTWYYSKDFGFVYMKVNRISFNDNSDKVVDIEISYAGYLEDIDSSQLRNSNDLYPFVADSIKTDDQQSSIEDTDTDLYTLWPKIEGVWYDIQNQGDYIELFVIDYDGGIPIAYYMWINDLENAKSNNAYVTDVVKIGNGEYEVTLKEEHGAWKWIFDLNTSGELIITDVSSNVVFHYTFLSSTLEEIYDKVF